MDLNLFKRIDPDKIYLPGSQTFTYVPNIDKVYIWPYPHAHYDMLEDKEIFQAVFGDYLKAHPEAARHPNLLQTRGQALDHTNTVMGRIGIYGKEPVIAFWNKLNSMELKKVLNKIVEAHPGFDKLFDSMVLKMPKTEPYMLLDFLNNKINREISTTGNHTTGQDLRQQRYQINGKWYSLGDIDAMRKAVHTMGARADKSIICHPDMKKYPALHGYIPAACDKPDSSIKTIDKLRQQTGDFYVGKYGESSFSAFFKFQEVFD